MKDAAVFCIKCEKKQEVEEIHSYHEDKVIQWDEFKKLLGEYKAKIQFEVRRIIDRTHRSQLRQSMTLQLIVQIKGISPLYEFYLNEIRLDNPAFSASFLQVFDLVVAESFWYKINQNLNQTVMKALQSKPHIKKMIENPEFIRIQNQSTIFNVKFSAVEALAVSANAFVDLLKKQITSISQQQRIINYSSKLLFKPNSLDRLDRQIQMANSMLLQLPRLKGEELNKALSILTTQQPAPPSQLMLFYNSVRAWIAIEIKVKGQIFFRNTQNKKLEEIQDSQEYKDLLFSACSKGTRPVLLAMRALAFIQQKDYSTALKELEEAKQRGFDCDCLQYSIQYCKTRIGEGVYPIHNIPSVSTLFVVNMAKRFKSIRNRRNLLECCEELVFRQPNNTSFQVQLAKTLMRLRPKGFQSKAKALLRHLQSRIKPELQSELQRRLLLSEMHLCMRDSTPNQERIMNILDSASQLRGSGSVFYGMAVLHFNQSNFTEGLQAINRAIEMSNKPQYILLKFYLQLHNSHFEEAFALIPDLKQHTQLNEIFEIVEAAVRHD